MMHFLPVRVIHKQEGNMKSKIDVRHQFVTYLEKSDATYCSKKIEDDCVKQGIKTEVIDDTAYRVSC